MNKEKCQQIDELCDEWEQFISQHDAPYPVTDFLTQVPDAWRSELLREMLLIEQALTPEEHFSSKIDAYINDSNLRYYAAVLSEFVDETFNEETESSQQSLLSQQSRTTGK